eukprot:2627287-Prymnesium_polylepis.2
MNAGSCRAAIAATAPPARIPHGSGVLAPQDRVASEYRLTAHHRPLAIVLTPTGHGCAFRGHCTHRERSHRVRPPCSAESRVAHCCAPRVSD